MIQENNDMNTKKIPDCDSDNDVKKNNELDSLLEKLRPFQREGFEFATSANVGGRILLADEMGLGKTVTSLAIMLAYQEEWPLLVLCPASLRYTWPAEIEKFYPWMSHSSIYVVKGFDDCDFFSNSIKKSRIKIVIATYSILQNRSAASRVLQQFKFKCIIADESHNLKEKNSQRCKLAMPMLQNAKRLMLLTGTPALARPVELWSQLHCLNGDLFGSYTHFTKRYCNARRSRFGWDVSGLSNADELHQKLKTVMVRRLKANVLKDLPPKQRSIIPVQIQNPKDVKKCSEIVSQLNETRASIRSLTGDEASSADFEARKLLMQAWHCSGVGKAEAVAAYVVDWLKGSGTQKLLVFAHHCEVLDTIENAVSKHLKGVGHIRIDGSVATIDRAARVRKFQTKSQVRLGILSVTAAGVGLTLTAASTVIFAELHWTPGVLAQAEDRTHRIGQVNAVNIMYCVCKDTELSVDMSLWSMIGRKVNNIGKMIDGEKNASLNAVDAENCVTELADFFAENGPSSEASIQKKAPVKGSIQSFFVRKSKTDNSSKIADQSSNIITPDSSKNRKCEIISLPVTRTTSWACKICTFINEERSKSKGCEMCGELSHEVSISNEVVHPSKRVVLISSHTSSEVISLIDTTKPVLQAVSDPVVPRSTQQNSFGANNESRSLATSGNVIDLCNDGDDDDDDDDEDEKGNCILKNKGVSLIRFSVSPNSGRLAIHNSKGDTMNVNFEIDEVILDSTSDKMLETQLKRKFSQRNQSISHHEIEINDAGVERVVKQLCSTNPFKPATFSLKIHKERLSYEIKEFVRLFLSLREVDKRAIKEWGVPIKYNELRETLKTIWLPLSTKPKQQERYSGGSKERAIENMAAGCASDVDKRVLSGFACCWCGGNLPNASLRKGVQSTYCSHECAEEGRLRRGGMYASSRIRQQLFSLEAGVCQICGVDAHALFLRIQALQPVQRLSALQDVKWISPKSSRALNRLLQNPKECDFWQADHKIPVMEGGGSCGLDNFRTLCTPCHNNETEHQRSRNRLSNPCNEPKKVVDIRTLLVPNNSKSEISTSKKRKY